MHGQLICTGKIPVWFLAPSAVDDLFFLEELDQKKKKKISNAAVH